MSIELRSLSKDWPTVVTRCMMRANIGRPNLPEDLAIVQATVDLLKKGIGMTAPRRVALRARLDALAGK